MMLLPRIRHHWPAFLIIAGLFASSVRAATSEAASSHARLPTITIAMVSDINTLDPAVSSSYYDRQVLNNVMDKLFDLDSKGHIVPMLATGYKVSKDHRTYTISLRKGVRFQDGTPFNAQAVKFNLDRYRQASSAPRAVELKLVDSVATSGSYAVKVRLSEPFSPLISILTDRSGMMVSPKAVQTEGSSFALHPVGTGPFMLKDRVKGDHITLVRNPHYWRKGYPKAGQVIFKIFTDPNTQLVNLQSGQVDFMDSVTSQNVSTVQRDKSFKLIEKPGYGWGGFWINTKSAALGSKQVREAISLLIDRKQFVKVAAGKTAIASASPFGPGELAYGSWDKAPKQDVKAAKQLLARAHATNVTFTFATTTAPISLQQAQIVQSMLQAGGITMKIQSEDFPTLLDALSKHNFEAGAVAWSGRPDPDQNSYNHFFTGGPNNYGQYSSATTDKYLNLGRAQIDVKKRKADYGKVAQQLSKDVPYVFLDHANNSFAMKSSLKGFIYVPDGIIRAAGMTK
ncbi:MAG: ABC transporter substrate-binding protein [Chloroflexota bacterium]|nr:MAG: peptide ABC transporter substrate-binding protein [Chloroflexota bacterium]